MESKRQLFNIINESTKFDEVDQDVFDLFPDPVVVIIDDYIVIANNEACRLFGISCDRIKDRNIYSFFSNSYAKIARKRIKEMLIGTKTKYIYELKINHSNNNTMNVEATSKCITYKGKKAIISVLRDITEMKRTENRITEIQRKTLQKISPMPNKVFMESVFVPAKTVSGDFFRIYKINDSLIIGIIFDVCGNGITSALSISAFDVLFHQESMINNRPLEILNNLNKKLVDYLGEVYIAACCFSMDFNKNIVNAAGAGINQFIYQRKGECIDEKIVKGPFLGMFEESIFEEEIIHFSTGDKFYFFTDGLEFILDEDKVIQRYMQKVSITEFKNFIYEFLNGTILELGCIDDDSTLLALEIK